jgi:uncharacterized protein
MGHLSNKDKDEVERLTLQYGGEWGLNHTKRLLRLIKLVGDRQDYDPGITWMAAYLHDWGAYKPFAQPDVDHVQRSVEVARQYLTHEGYEPEFVEAVMHCIESHHQGVPYKSIEAQILGDADILDFLGVIGILRDFAKKPKAMREAYEVSQKRMRTLPERLCFETSRAIAAERLQEMQDLFDRLEMDSFGRF